MNYIAEIKAFYDSLELNPSLTHTAVNLWHALMHIANKSCWQESFTVAISTLEAKTGLNKQAIIRARNQLVQNGYIAFESRKGNLSAVYRIISLCDKKNTCFDTQNDTQCDTHDDTQNDTQCDTHGDTINKLNETKLNETKKEKSKKEKFGEYRHVKLTHEQYQQLCSDYGQSVIGEYIKKIDEWIQLNGKKEYADSNLAMRNWLNRDNVVKVKPQATLEHCKPIIPRTSDEIANMSMEDLFING